MKNRNINLMILFIFTVILNSCAILDKYSTSSTSVDLSKFKKQGIFVTTGDLSKSYEAISIIAIDCYSGFEQKTTIKPKKEVKEANSRFEDIYAINQSGFDKKSDYRYKSCSIDEIFEEIIIKAKECGANGIIKLEIRNVSRPGINPKKIQTGIEVVGLAIKIDE